MNIVGRDGDPGHGLVLVDNIHAHVHVCGGVASLDGENSHTRRAVSVRSQCGGPPRDLGKLIVKIVGIAVRVGHPCQEHSIPIIVVSIR